LIPSIIFFIVIIIVVVKAVQNIRMQEAKKNETVVRPDTVIGDLEDYYVRTLETGVPGAADEPAHRTLVPKVEDPRLFLQSLQRGESLRSAADSSGKKRPDDDARLKPGEQSQSYMGEGDPDRYDFRPVSYEADDYEESHIPSMKMDGQRLVDAFVFSQVLDKPRGMRPYGRR
jgi:hypothetical protein